MAEIAETKNGLRLSLNTKSIRKTRKCPPNKGYSETEIIEVITPLMMVFLTDEQAAKAHIERTNPTVIEQGYSTIVARKTSGMRERMASSDTFFEILRFWRDFFIPNHPKINSNTITDAAPAGTIKNCVRKSPAIRAMNAGLSRKEKI